MHHPDGVWMFTPLVEDTLGLLLTPWIGSCINSKSANIINGTLDWYCPSEYLTISLLFGISILTASFNLQYT